jgi:peptidyl-prolyl cis-trans isomerase SurA
MSNKKSALRRGLLVLLFTVFALPLGASLLGQTIATVTLTTTVGITSRELDRRVEQVLAARREAGLPLTGVDREDVLDAMISEILIRQAAERSGITVGAEELRQVIAGQKSGVEQQIGRSLTEAQFREIVLNQAGLSWEQYQAGIREQIIQQRYLTTTKRAIFESIVPPTEREIREQYEDNATEITNPEYVRLRQIFIPTLNKSDPEKQSARRRLEEAWNRLRNGTAKFEDLVLQYSEDESSKYRGGDVGYVARDDQRVQQTYGRSFFRTLFELRAGDFSGVIESSVGLHILRVTEYREARILGLDDPIAPDNPMTVREYIRAGLFQERQQRALKRALDEVVQELKKEAEIVRY